MALTEKELKRARSLQRRLKLLRAWDKVGHFCSWPWRFYKRQQDEWHAELEVLYHKHQAAKAAEDFRKSHTGNPNEYGKEMKDAEAAFKEVNRQFDEILSLFKRGWK